MDAIADRIEGSAAPAVAPAGLGEMVAWRQSPKYRRRTYLGFGIGFVLGIVVTAVQVFLQGYQILPFKLIFDLIAWPCVGLGFARNLGRPRRIGPRQWGSPQFRTQTLMLVVAYVALVLGLGVSTQRLGSSASVYYQKYATAASMATTFEGIGLKSKVTAERARANVEGLRSGKIPEGLQPGQRDFLRGLEVDPKVTPEYRQVRRKAIEDTEAWVEGLHARNEVVYAGLVAYNRLLAAKYDRARWHPWRPVEPDPPMPPTQ